MIFRMIRPVLSIGFVISLFCAMQPAHSAPYAVVEQWNGARHRVKRVPVDSDPIVVDSDDRDARITPDGRWESVVPYRSNQARNIQTAPIQNADQQQFGNANRGMQPPDAVLNPKVDANGIRHFSNGKHFDLSKMSVDQAVENTGKTEVEAPDKSAFDDSRAQQPMHRRHRRDPYNTTAWW
jgi:hypothetical protein